MKATFRMGSLTVGTVPFLKGLTLTMYLAGAIGLSLEASRDLFQALTPWNLVFTAGLLVWLQPERSRGFWLFMAVATGAGFAVEVLGVATGFPFGEYAYGKTLGPKVWGVPLTIALNWWVLAYTSGLLVYQYLRVHWLVQAGLAAAIMVVLDIIMEPVAIRYDFWHWTAKAPPLENYLGWLLVSFLIQLVFFRLSFKKKHPLGVFFLALQFAFFILCSLLA